MDELLSDFLTEAGESLAELDAALLRLEAMPDDRDTLARIFRQLHNIKGTCGFLGLARLERLAHAGETVLARLRDGGLAANPAVVNPILAALDRIRSILDGLAITGSEPPGDDAGLIGELEAAAAGRQMRLRMSPPARPDASAAAAEEPAADTVRVAVAALDSLMALAGELILTRNQLVQLVRERPDDRLAAALARLSQLTTELHAGVMQARLQPIGQAWAKLPRLVRGLAAELGKQIELERIGAETALDRQMLELIRDPLTHMVRNSADHGIETPAARRTAGKPEGGRITLRAAQEGGSIRIEVEDDGAGLKLAGIRAKAAALGIATEAGLAAMSEADTYQLIFHPGFSTAAEVNAVSGRGVGMDVVRTNIERTGGRIELASWPGQGTRFTLRIPLTLAIANVLIIEAGGERFAVPQRSVTALIRVGGTPDAKDGPVIEWIGPARMLRRRGGLLPVVALDDLLRLRQGAGDRGGALIHYVVVTQTSAGPLGLLVDHLFDTEEIVVKPMAPILRHLTMFGGNTILGDGTVIMILDPDGIARAAGLADRTADRFGAAAGADPDPAIDPAIDPAAPASAMLLFHAADATPLAVRLAHVLRVETIARSSIEHAGGSAVVQYRGRLMRLLAPRPPIRPSGAPTTGAPTTGAPTTGAPTTGAPTTGAPKIGAPTTGATQTMIVLGNDAARVGLAIDAVSEVVEEPLVIEPSAMPPGWLGIAVLAGRATEILDADYWLDSGCGGANPVGDAASVKTEGGSTDGLHPAQRQPAGPR